ncbi:MAG: diaminopimelate decarboxylase [Thermodesulfovibrionia bacterium]|nr:diaminopimelate decarboxylase [Thermodesulfovibrionia bacterium]
MHDFKYKNSKLYAENVPVERIAREIGTPVYIYSHDTFLRHLNAYKDAFDGRSHIICFALKANSNLAILKLLAKNGSGADVVSGGELYLALKAGIPAKKIVYAGVGKTDDEITYALNSKILMFNVESFDELKAINRVAKKLNVKAPIALRVNPDIDPKTHPYISTGLKESKFGIPIKDALEHYALAKRLSNIEILGIHKHIGSQITQIRPFVDALKKILILADSLRAKGINIKNLDIGGGLGIPYNNEEPPHPKDLSKAILPLLNKYDFNLILEPGRSIAGNAGILVTKALYIKEHADKEFAVVDAGMNDLIRPSLYNAFHNIIPVKKNSRKKVSTDIVGPICESGDFLGKNRTMNRVMPGDLLAVMSAGAYGFTMSSTYNSRPRIAEVIVKGDKYFVIREREDNKVLERGIKIPEFLK